MAKAKWRAGAARVDITPELGVQLNGDIGRYRPTEEIRDRLYANALVAEAGKQRVCLITADLCVTTNAWADQVRQRAAQRYGLDPHAIVFHLEQNHAAPSLGNLFVRDECTLMPAAYPWLRGGHEAYNEPTVEKIVGIVGEAVARLEPVTLRYGRGTDGRVAFNRRFIMRDGSGKCHPRNCDPNILQCEGPIDPEVGVATLSNGGGQAVAVLLHHTCHPCHGYPHRYVISDWPGVWAELARQRLGSQCVPLVINGCCGNIHHCNHLDPKPRHDHRAMAALLMETTDEILGRLAGPRRSRNACRPRSLRRPAS